MNNDIREKVLELLQNLGRRRGPHPHARELTALRSSVLAWHRGVLESWYRNCEAEATLLDRRRAALDSYAGASGEADPFTQHVLAVSLGGLSEPLFLEALYRIEAGAAIAWALGLIDTLPPYTEGADVHALSRLFPIDASPAPAVRAAMRAARLRSRDILEARLAGCRAELKRRQEKMAEAAAIRVDPGEEASVHRSRAFERVRGLGWVCEG
jgi:hypothetical protein